MVVGFVVGHKKVFGGGFVSSDACDSVQEQQCDSKERPMICVALATYGVVETCEGGVVWMMLFGCVAVMTSVRSSD